MGDLVSFYASVRVAVPASMAVRVRRADGFASTEVRCWDREINDQLGYPRMRREVTNHVSDFMVVAMGASAVAAMVGVMMATLERDVGPPDGAVPYFSEPDYRAPGPLMAAAARDHLESLRWGPDDLITNHDGDFVWLEQVREHGPWGHGHLRDCCSAFAPCRHHAAVAEVRWPEGMPAARNGRGDRVPAIPQPSGF